MWSSMNFCSRCCRALVLAEYTKSMSLPLVSSLLGEGPGQFGHGSRAGAGCGGLGAGCGAGLHPLGDALQDGGDAEQVVGHVEIPVGLERIDRAEPGAFAVAADVLVFRRNAQRGVV